MKTRLLSILALIGALAFVIGIVTDSAVLRIATKPWPILCLLVWLWPLESRDARWIGVGLVFSVVGDLLLEISTAFFVAGLLAFLLAHVCYIGAFLGRSRAPAIVPTLAAGIFGVCVFLWLKPSLGGLEVPVVVYTCAICLMLARAFAGWWYAAQDLDRRRGLWAFAGATSFVVSDVLVAYSRFVEAIVAIKIVLIALYWLGQWGIAASARPAGRI